MNTILRSKIEYLIRNIVIIFLFSMISLSIYGQGLSFSGNDKKIDERSSYIVLKKVQTFNSSFFLKFDLRIDNLNDFGYIFRLKDKESSQIINLTYAHQDSDQECLLRLNTESEKNLFNIKLKDYFVRNKQWIPVSLKFDLDNNKMDFSVANQTFEVDLLDTFFKKITPWICFGKSDHIVDVPAFSLRNLKMGNVSNDFIFLFKESKGLDVYDQRNHKMGEVINPKWLINESYYWKQIFEYSSSVVSGISFNESKQDILFFNKDSLVTYDLASLTVKSQKYENKLPVSMQLGTNFIDTLRNRLYVYEVNNLPVGDITMAYLDLSTMCWSPVSTDYLPQQLHHHDGFFDYTNDRYLVFGGFGNRRYNDKIYSMDLSSGKWSVLRSIKGDMYPRYFSGWTLYNSDLYVFGGIGNESGDQTIGREYLYDLYQIDVNSLSVQKRIHFEHRGQDFVPTRNLIMLSDTTFYALCYPEFIPNSHLKLFQFNINTRIIEEYGDSIPMTSEKIPSNANLYYDKQLKKLYATTQEFKDDGSSISRVFVLDFPPIDSSSLLLYDQKSYFWYYIIFSIAIMIILTLGLLEFKKKKVKRLNYMDQDGNLICELGSAIDVSESTEQKETVNYKNTIFLFGDFAVYDKYGYDITHLFSTRLIHTFLLFVEYANKGIPAQLLSEKLWPEKDEYSAKNIRNVTINHLRKILADIPNIKIIFEKGLYFLEIKESELCDYIYYQGIIDERKSFIENKDIINILNRGAFLKNIESPLMDSFKSRVNDKIISILELDIEELYSKNNYNQAIHLCDTLSLFLPEGTIAIKYKSKALIRLGYTTEAKRYFSINEIQYKNLKQANLPFSFDELIDETKE